VALTCTFANSVSIVNGASTMSLLILTGTVVNPGDVMVVCQSGDNGGGGGSASMGTPTMTGETFTQARKQNYDPGASRAGNTLGIFYCIATTQHGVGDTITCNHAATDSTTAILWIVSSVATPSVTIPRISSSGTVAYSTQGGTTGASGTSGTITTGTITVGSLVIGVTSTQDRVIPLSTPDTDTTNGSWSSARSAVADSAVALTSMVCSSQYKIQTTTNSTQTYNTGWTLSTTYLLGYIVFTESVAPLTPREGLVVRQCLPSMYRAAVR
jgi:hypothetical protein